MYFKLKLNTYYMSTWFPLHLFLSRFNPDINELVEEHQVRPSNQVGLNLILIKILLNMIQISGECLNLSEYDFKYGVKYVFIIFVLFSFM